DRPGGLARVATAWRVATGEPRPDAQGRRERDLRAGGSSHREGAGPVEGDPAGVLDRDGGPVGRRHAMSLRAKIRRTGRVAEAAVAAAVGDAPEAARRLGGSVAIRAVDGGLCNGCVLEIAVVFVSHFDVER